MNLGERIKLIRGATSRDKFAPLTGISKNTLVNYETGDRTPSADYLAKILELFPDISPAWLLIGEGDMKRKGGVGQLLSETGYNDLFVNVIQAAIETSGKVNPETARIYAHCAFDIAALISESRDDLPDVQEIKGMFAVFMMLENKLTSGELKLKQRDYKKIVDMTVRSGQRKG
ncbi:MAG: helix-turn-helix transcriptional regulator [Deltaproteobacteria bacterium]|nr:helix-turn-helix transcriptional regulator [Deltaproteobacteria bacterium]